MRGSPRISRRGRAMAICALAAVLGTVQEARADLTRKDVQEVKKTVIFLGLLRGDQEPVFMGTGFLMRVESVYFLVTARHVVAEFRDGAYTGSLLDQDLYVFLNNRNGHVGARSLAQAREGPPGAEWIFHDDPQVDLAMLPLQLDREVEDFLTIPDHLIVKASELYETQQVFFLSFQLGVKGASRVEPVFRQGMISLKQDEKSFFVDGFAFPGNSGSPVFLMPQPLRFTDTGLTLGDKLGGKFIGVVGQYVSYNEVAVSKKSLRPRVVYEQNVGLSRVWAAELLEEMTAYPRFRDQIESLKLQESKAVLP